VRGEHIERGAVCVNNILAMKKSGKRIALIVSGALLFSSAYPASAGNPVGDFFKKLGDSIAHPKGTPAPKKNVKKKPASGTKKAPQSTDTPEATPDIPSEPSPTATQGTKVSLSQHPTPTPIQKPTPMLAPNPLPGKLAAKPTPLPKRTPMPVPLVVRSAVSVPPSRNPLPDLPFGIPLPNKPGFVTSPFAPKSGFVDVRGFPSGTEVKDPYTGKNFLVP
jgi:hypothetical protein